MNTWIVGIKSETTPDMKLMVWDYLLMKLVEASGNTTLPVSLDQSVKKSRVDILKKESQENLTTEWKVFIKEKIEEQEELIADYDLTKVIISSSKGKLRVEHKYLCDRKFKIKTDLNDFPKMELDITLVKHFIP